MYCYKCISKPRSTFETPCNKCWTVKGKGPPAEYKAVFPHPQPSPPPPKPKPTLDEILGLE